MQTQSKVLKWSVIAGIVIVLNLFFNYALSLAYGQPDYEDYCPQTQVVTIPDNSDQCVAEGGQWTENQNYDSFKPASRNPETTGPQLIQEAEPVRGYCDLQYTCRQAFEAANDTYNRNVFVVLVVLGALSVLVGNFLVGNAVISNGLALAGVLSFIIASMRYWSAADDIVRVIILAIALGILFWIAYKKFNERLRP